MARTHTISGTDLLGRLSLVFRERGFSGASLSELAAAAGLRKASLYHRFPRGKAQMAEEVLNDALGWYKKNVLEPLNGPGTPAVRLAAVAHQLDAFYAGGRQACLLNMLGGPREENTPFADAIKAAFEAITTAFAGLAEEAGIDSNEARTRAERMVMFLHGSLVVARGTGSDAPFKFFLSQMQQDLLAGA
jgi:TetR/AcrR family transcriptional regulator, lmrAB and yxaGH operons repressor